MTGHRLLFCSSYLASETALALQLAVESKGHTVTHWQDLFRRETSNQFTEVIIKDLQQEDFVVVFLTPDASVSNQTKEGAQSSFVPNPNLIFELGLAWGAIGADRVIMVRLNSQERRPQLPSDLEGITRIDQFSVEELRNVDRLKALVEAITNAMAHKARTLALRAQAAEQERRKSDIPWLSLINCKFGMQEELYRRLVTKSEKSEFGVEIIETGVVWGPFDNFLLYKAPDVASFVQFVTALRKQYSGLIKGVDSRMVFPNSFWRDDYDDSEEHRIRPFRHLVLLSCSPNSVEAVFGNIKSVAKEDAKSISDKVNITTAGVLTGDADLFFITASKTVESHHQMMRQVFHHAIKRNMEESEWSLFTNTTSLLMTQDDQ